MVNTNPGPARIGPGGWSAPLVLLVLAGTAFGQGAPVAGQPDRPQPLPPAAIERIPAPPKVAEGEAAPQGPDTPEFRISGLDLEYDQAHPGHVPIEDLMLTQVTLRRLANGAGIVGPRAVAEGSTEVKLTIAGLNEALGAAGGSEMFSPTALRAVVDALVRALGARGQAAVWVQTDPNQIDPESNVDLREEGKTRLTFRLYTAVVTQVRTVSAGESTPEGERIDNPVHARIARGSPVKPTPPGTEGVREDLLRKDLLDSYVLRLNRQPGRRVDVALSGAEEPGGVVLDYLIRENRPWLLFAQISNTGTEQTELWRERIGFLHNNLTGHDDRLTLDYSTGGLEATHAFSGSYLIPLGDDGVWRASAFGGYNEFDASQVGQSTERFTGNGHDAGAEVIATVWQARETFVDAYARLRFQHIETNNKTVMVTGADDFLLPAFGLRLERYTEEATTDAGIGIEFNLPELAGTEIEEVEKLGRLETDAAFTILRFNVDQAFYLEPLLDGENYRAGNSTLAHEVVLSIRGQYAFDHRLVPNFEDIAGGLYTVRGYPESVVAGDNSVIGSVEYRFHLPRALGVQKEPGKFLGQDFRWVPGQPYGRPDWDLILKGFLDVGRTINNQRLATERDETLVGGGIGIELQFQRNINVRLDYGVAIEGVEGIVDPGDSRLHLVATFLF